MSNRRTKMTRALIEDALVELLKDLPLEKISVKHLCEEADVNRSTFYAHYSNISDVMDGIKESFVNDHLNVFENIDKDSYNYAINYLNFLKENSDKFFIIIRNTNIVHETVNKLENALIAAFEKTEGPLPKSLYGYAKNEFASVIYGFGYMAMSWMKHGCPYPESYIVDGIAQKTLTVYKLIKEKID